MYYTSIILVFLLNGVIQSNGLQKAQGINYDFNRIQQVPDLWPVERKNIPQNTHENLKNEIDKVFHNSDRKRNLYPAKQDPKLFYQSEIYKEIVNNNNINNDVSSIVLDRNVQTGSESEPIIFNNKHRSVCVICPNDMTLVAKPGSDRVLLQMPRIKSCSGYRAPRHYYFKQMYGPQIGSLIQKGSHMIVGRIMQNNFAHQLCKLQVHVITQGCSVPDYLLADCDTAKGTCNMECRNRKLILYGSRTLSCGSNMKWNNKLPICKAPSGCEPPSVPDHGHISCKGGSKMNGPRFIEGARCRVLCQKGWKPSSKPSSVCRRGNWNRSLNCTKKVL